MQNHVADVSKILHEAAETHHTVYRIFDGNDPDWASWYADWMISLSQLPKVLGITPVRSELIYLLVNLDKEYVRRQPSEAWELFYAAEIISHLATPADR